MMRPRLIRNLNIISLNKKALAFGNQKQTKQANQTKTNKKLTTPKSAKITKGNNTNHFEMGLYSFMEEKW